MWALARTSPFVTSACLLTSPKLIVEFGVLLPASPGLHDHYCRTPPVPLLTWLAAGGAA
jgi:hypothetical protein